MGTTQISVRIENHILDHLDKFVDGIHYRSRAQVMVIALIDWMQRHGAELSVLDSVCLPQQLDEDEPAQVVQDRRFKAMFKSMVSEMVESGELGDLLTPKKGKKR